MQIIVVDDEKIALEGLVNTIRECVQDSEVTGYRRPLEALEYIKNHNVDIAFLDIVMPQMNRIELAKELKKYNNRINIVFTTAYKEYGYEAFTVHASGYLLKPVTKEDIKLELEHLRNDVTSNQSKKGIYAVTFGTFDIMVDGHAVKFSRSGAKEILAYLIDRHGSGVTKKEIAAVLFEDEEYSRKVQDYVNKFLRDMADSLKKAGAFSILVKQRNYYAVDVDKFTCDLYEYEKGEPEALNAFKGEYMSQYSWSEETLGRLLE